MYFKEVIKAKNNNQKLFLVCIERTYGPVDRFVDDDNDKLYLFSVLIFTLVNIEECTEHYLKSLKHLKIGSVENRAERQ